MQGSCLTCLTPCSETRSYWPINPHSVLIFKGASVSTPQAMLKRRKTRTIAGNKAAKDIQGSNTFEIDTVLPTWNSKLVLVDTGIFRAHELQRGRLPGPAHGVNNSLRKSVDHIINLLARATKQKEVVGPPKG
eukprot:TRINITY_DN23128_c0_g1_i1.p2 TRINITY_DN23128_c0_g1~~TRINITY_DN23128_c0_g1_i1.p2  ORF type:complete len:133 (-),score=6.01 TRINITY_DN23128_c0_g1_i1:8-406(-)